MKIFLCRCMIATYLDVKKLIGYICNTHVHEHMQIYEI